MNICFFGASVSEQDQNHVTKEVTGYVTSFIELLQKKGYSDISVLRVTAGSSNMDDAGLAYISKVVELQPNICFLDWATPKEENCQVESVNYIYSELIENKILPVALILPRKDRSQKNTPLYKKLENICEEYSLPFFDISDKWGHEKLNFILRDVVHTSSYGAKSYANKVYEYFKNLEYEKYTLNKFPDSSLCVFKANNKNKLNKAKKMHIKLSKLKKSGCFSFMLLLEQRVGPWSGFIDYVVQSKDIENNNIVKGETLLFDPWCWRERQCIKRILPWTKVEGGENVDINVSVSNKSVIYGAVKDKCDFDEYHKELRPKGDLYIIATVPISKLNVYYN